MRVAACLLTLGIWLTGSSSASTGAASDDVSGSERIVFSAGADMFGAGADIYTVNPDGSGQARLTSGTSRDTGPLWSPDRRQIAFVRLTAGRHLHVMVMDASGRSLREIAADGHSPAWSPDGKRIAFARGYESNTVVWTVNSDGSKARRLARGQDPSWSPDGRRIAFARVDGDALAVFVMNSDGTQARRVVDERRLEGSREPACRRTDVGLPSLEASRAWGVSTSSR